MGDLFLILFIFYCGRSGPSYASLTFNSKHDTYIHGSTPLRPQLTSTAPAVTRQTRQNADDVTARLMVLLCTLFKKLHIEFYYDVVSIKQTTAMIHTAKSATSAFKDLVLDY